MDTCGWEKRSVAEKIDGLDDCRWHDHYCCFGQPCSRRTMLSTKDDEKIKLLGDQEPSPLFV